MLFVIHLREVGQTCAKQMQTNWSNSFFLIQGPLEFSAAIDVEHVGVDDQIPQTDGI